MSTQFKRFVLCLLAVALMLSAFSAVAEDRKTTSAASQEQYDKIVTALASDPSDLLPLNMNRGTKPKFYWEIYETLFTLKDGMYYIPSLAKEYEIADDTHYVVTIYDDIYDSEGNHITAEDVVFSYEWRVSTGETVGMANFVGIKAVGDYTVEIEFAANPSIYAIGSCQTILCRQPIFSKTAFENHNFAVDPIGTGPYVVKEYITDSRLVLEANPEYWALKDKEAYEAMGEEHRAYVKTIEYDIVKEAAQRVTGLQTGRLDFVESVSKEDVVQFKEGGRYADKFNVAVLNGSSYLFLEPNLTEQSKVYDINLRKAIFYAINNDVLAEIFSGNPCKAWGKGDEGNYNPAWETQENNFIGVYDEAKAKEYLKASGYKGETIVLLCRNNEMEKNVAVMIQAFAAQIGVTMEVKALDPTVIQSGVREDATAWDFYLQPRYGSVMLSANDEWNGAVDGINTGLIYDQTMQELFEKCVNLETANSGALDDLFNYLMDNAMTYSVFTQTNNLVYSKDIADLFYNGNATNYQLGSCTYYLD